MDVFEPPVARSLASNIRARARARIRPGSLQTSPRRAARRALRERLREQFDLVWFADLLTFACYGTEGPAQSAVDIARVESLNLTRELAVGRPGSVEGRNISRKTDRWREVERQFVPRACFASVCNDIDRRALGLSPTVSSVVPTGYPEPRNRRGDVELHDPPTLMLQGTLYLKQNADAAWYTVEHILPRVRHSMPDTQLRVVGPGPAPLLAALNARPGVVATGYVEDISHAVMGADIAIAPIRHGGGIHVKVIEAFAHMVPVVTSPIGAEGIDPKHAWEAVVAETADDFADSCVELLDNPGLRARIAEGGRRLFESRFEMSRVTSRLADIVAEVARCEAGNRVGSELYR